GYKVIVTAQDGVTKVTYTISVQAAPPSGAATLTSTIGTVSAGGTANETIANIPYGTTLAQLKNAIVTVTGATYEVYLGDGITVATDLASGYKVIVTAQDGITKVIYTIAVMSAPPSGGGSPIFGNAKVVSSDGKLFLFAGEEGEVSLEKEIVISIPANATDKPLKITIDKITNTGGLLANNEVLASAMFEILKNFPENFKKQVTMTFRFNPASLKSYQKPAVFYYDEGKKIWIEVTGSTINGNYITVRVDHFTKFAVFAVGQASDQPTETDPAIKLRDIAGHWAELAIQQAVNRGIVSGYSDGTFKPNRIVTRAEFTVMLVNLLKPQGPGSEPTFSDASKLGVWAKSAVAQAVQAGYIKGYKDGTFRPNEAITRAEMMVMIANALQLTLDSSSATGFADEKNIPSWAKGAVAALRKLGYIQGSGSNHLNPNDKATRAEAVTVLLKLSPQKND
ncbi:S-layer homology domain-containing protein, partial [Cohnella mopanensis]|uniref:S-layer homology domain-containing protein n=1 Tax=Cohnella mopanensis TaxID=2911966 RepID=UPI001EF79725